MERIAVNKDTFDKMVGVLTNMPYAQVAQLLQEVSENMEVIEDATQTASK